LDAREKHKLRDASLKTGEATSERAKAEQLGLLLDQHRGEHHIIVLQSYPDPDAISSALAHQMISANRDIECDIAYDGVISHHENIALVERLNINLLRIDDQNDLSRYQRSVFVDNQGTTTGLTDRLAAAKVPVLAVVDHHEPQGIIEAEFTDIRDTSATATIYTQYIEAGLLRLERNNPEHARLATALMHGIRSETGGLIRAGHDDYLALSYLAEFADEASLATIISVERPRRAMDVIKAALEARVVRDNYSIAGVGYLRYEDRDAIPQAADFLLTEENVHTAIVYGIVTKPNEREAIVGSLRTKKPTLNPDTFLKEALGGAEPGRYYGGGRREAGGFEIPVGFLAGTYEEELMRWKWRLYDAQIKRKIWTKLGLPLVQQPNRE
jgi:nanoRNase/pAp phosphatase (c-di-AMP/oligoRNAs hydrolase)